MLTMRPHLVDAGPPCRGAPTALRQPVDDAAPPRRQATSSRSPSLTEPRTLTTTGTAPATSTTGHPPTSSMGTAPAMSTTGAPVSTNPAACQLTQLTGCDRHVTQVSEHHWGCQRPKNGVDAPPDAHDERGANATKMAHTRRTTPTASERKGPGE
jgi:hypothetical protein